MISSLRIENYRCFKQLEIKDLARFNIVVGKNGSGKSSLLEAIILPGGGPRAIGIFRAWRGQPQIMLTQTQDQFETYWKDLFYKFSQNRPILLDLIGENDSNTRHLKIFYEKPSETPLFQEGPNVNVRIPLIFETKTISGEVFKTELSVTSGGIALKGETPPATVAMYQSAASMDNVTTANNYSILDIRKQTSEINAAIKLVFPHVGDLTIQSIGGATQLYCDMPDMLEKMPIAVISNGICKLIAIILQIAANPGGIYLIDGIEEGFHYSVYSKVWELIISYCKSNNVQLFATTHSDEFLKALIPFFKKEEDEFRLLRATETDKSNKTIYLAKGADFAAALETNTELR
jgi:AAA ATPase-like protein/putative AbiEii toxin of type IV toxin-antitoxin system